MTKGIIASLATVAALLACNGATGSSRGGELTAEWLGSDTGGISGKPSTAWCRSDTMLKLFVTKGEDGVGVAIFPPDSLTPGSYPVFDVLVDSVRPRPGVTVAGRWVDDKTVAAYQSDSGSLDLTREPTGLAGRFTVRLHGVNSADTVRMTGHFGGITPGACPSDPRPAKAPTQ